MQWQQQREHVQLKAKFMSANIKASQGNVTSVDAC
jgi:hypothetical protein